MSRSDWEISQYDAAETAREERIERHRAIGLGPDGNYHNDPYCCVIAPFGSYEASHGEPCDWCERRRRAETAIDAAMQRHELDEEAAR